MKKYLKVFLSFAFVLIVSVFLLPQNSFASDFEFNWVKSLAGTGQDYTKSIIADSNGNIYSNGTFSGTADFDPGAGTANLTSAGGADIFISKLDSSGNYVWAKRVGSASMADDVFNNSIALDSLGENVYVLGQFYDTTDLDPGAGTANLTSAGSADIFILKLDSSGNYVWAKKIGGDGADISRSIVVHNNNIYITGYFSNTVDFDPGAGTANLTSAGGVDAFILKLDSSGNYVWAKSVGGTGNDEMKSVGLDINENLYLAGIFAGTADFDPGAGTANLTSAGGADIFILKLDSSGNYVWAKSVGGTGWEVLYKIFVNTIGSVYITGSFSNIVDFDPGAGTVNLTSAGSNDIFILKLDSSGNYVWAKSVGGTQTDNGKSIIADSNDNVYVVGQFAGTADFDPGAGTANLTSAGGDDIFILELDSSGNYNWVKKFGGVDSEAIDTFLFNIDYSSFFIGGTFSNTVDFDPGAGTTSLTSLVGGMDAYINKFSVPNPAPTASSVTISGTAKINQLLTGSYTYADADGDLEGTSTFRWLRDDVAIDGATSSTYTTVLADVGHTLKFEVTPVALTGTTPGVAVASSGTAILNSAPTASNLSITGDNSFVGTVITGSYTYSDLESDTEGASTFRWLRNSQSVGTSTSYTLTVDDIGKTLQFEVTPVASTGTTTGTAVTTTYTGNVTIKQSGRPAPIFVSTLPTPTQPIVTTPIIQPTPAPVFTKNINPNTKGTEVKNLQNLLKDMGYLKATPNGYYGPATKQAVKKYQKDHNIPQTGTVGPLTRKALEEEK